MGAKKYLLSREEVTTIANCPSTMGVAKALEGKEYVEQVTMLAGPVRQSLHMKPQTITTLMEVFDLQFPFNVRRVEQGHSSSVRSCANFVLNPGATITIWGELPSGAYKVCSCCDVGIDENSKRFVLDT